MHHQLRRALVAASLSAAVLGGTTTAAQADVTAPGCEELPALVTAAGDDADAAKKAFTTFTRSKAHEQVALLRAAELREARDAARAENKAAREVAKGLDKAARKEALAALKLAQKVAKQEAKDAKEVAKADRHELKALVKAERKELKAAWDAAKEALDELEELEAACEEAPVVDDTDTPDEGADEGTGEGTGEAGPEA
jgi:hypothetical protein